MRPIRFSIALSASVIVAAACGSTTQGTAPAVDPAPPPPASSTGPPRAASAGSTRPTRSTVNGVYTDAQARRGEETYASVCTGCHTSASHTGPTFFEPWTGRPVYDLFSYLTESMPKSDPGTLTPKEYASIVAFILKLNDMPPGQQELPADSTSLKEIQIDKGTLRESDSVASRATTR
jgi:mono/diheme cytochrome c family protein